MARWKLMADHYLVTVDKTEWEYIENDRFTGRPVRQRLQVPRYLGIKDPTCWTKKWGMKDDMEGEIIVRQGDGDASDIEFIGDPTPDMVPLDDEARAISAKYQEHWSYKPDTESPGGYSQSLVDKFQTELAEAQAKPATVQIEGMNDFMTVMAQLAQQNQRLMETVVDKGRRV